MNRGLALVTVLLLVLSGGVARADEFTRIEVGVGELRGEILSLFAPAGAIATETNPNYKGAAAPAPPAPPLARRRGLAELQQDADFGTLL
jgi:alcohol dehydrogenase (cytochrome c)